MTYSVDELGTKSGDRQPVTELPVAVEERVQKRTERHTARRDVTSSRQLLAGVRGSRVASLFLLAPRVPSARNRDTRVITATLQPEQEGRR